ncbi:hypothetical protein CERSUDRAFT_101529 [Gelatoporia subvermispora B]|uniref:Uncharacterized protein n=1 Tax=Ceriporiopsis subvermispora (strain B) TaxID=914234 RepID=M2Q0F1_CERS8|nr:hypothetical protein CERSUDRAFT_101529 [Gelatoporia subvermispora B]
MAVDIEGKEEAAKRGAAQRYAHMLAMLCMARVMSRQAPEHTRAWITPWESRTF